MSSSAPEGHATRPTWRWNGPVQHSFQTGLLSDERLPRRPLRSTEATMASGAQERPLLLLPPREAGSRDCTAPVAISARAPAAAMLRSLVAVFNGSVSFRRSADRSSLSSSSGAFARAAAAAPAAATRALARSLRPRGEFTRLSSALLRPAGTLIPITVVEDDRRVFFARGVLFVAPFLAFADLVLALTSISVDL